MANPIERPESKDQAAAKNDDTHAALLSDSIGRMPAEAKLPNLAAMSAKEDQAKNAALLDPTKMTFSEKTLRVGQVTAEGLVYTVPGVLHAVQHDLDPANWKETATKIGTAAAMGVVMRVALPEAGAFKAIVGTAMGVYFMKDAARPVLNAWYNVCTTPGDEVMTRSAKTMGDALGAFAVDSYVAGKVAGFTGRMTPVLAEKFVPNQWAALEGWKAAKMGPSSRISMELQSTIDYVDAKFQKVGDSLNPPRPRLEDLTREEILKRIAESRREGARSEYSDKVYAHGLKGSDGNSHGLERTVELLLEGKDPRKIPAGNAPESTPVEAGARSGGTKVEGWKQNQSGLYVPEYLEDGVKPTGKAPHVDASEAAAKGRSGSKVSRTSRLEDVPDKPTAPATEAERIVNAETTAKMAKVIKQQINSVDETSSTIRDSINRTTSAVHAATDPNFKKMDEGYLLARNAMMDLANQVGDDPQTYMEWDPLFQRLADASTQAHAAELGPNGRHVARMNRYTAENQTTYVRNMIKAGIDPEKALAQKPLPPLVELSDDLSPAGRDPKTGEVLFERDGPHTVPAIYGPKGEPIWPIDLIKYPIRELDTRGYLTSSIYGHEAFHDQFGQMGELDPAVRDSRLMAAAEKALGPDANKMVKLPKATPEEIAAAKRAARAEARRAAADGEEAPKAPRPSKDALPALPDEMPLKEVMVNVAKAWADEIFADWGATAESGQTISPYLQADRRGGKLFNGTIMSEEYRTAQNPLGIESHPVDKLRPRFQAALMKELATAGGKTDQLLLDYANALDKLSRDAGVKGPIIFASEDHPGQKMSIPESAFDKMLPELVKVQLETPLPKLQGKTLIEILPDLSKNMRRNEALSDLWVNAIKGGKEPNSIAFDKRSMKITNVYGAGQPTMLKLIADGMDPMKAAESVNKFSDFFGDKFIGTDPHVDPIKVPVTTRLELAPIATIASMPHLFKQKVGQVVAQQNEARFWIGNHAIPIAGASSALMAGDLMSSQMMQNLLNGQKIKEEIQKNQ
jgi:hypothetical protein